MLLFFSNYVSAQDVGIACEIKCWTDLMDATQIINNTNYSADCEAMTATKPAVTVPLSHPDYDNQVSALAQWNFEYYNCLDAADLQYCNDLSTVGDAYIQCYLACPPYSIED